MCNSAQCRTVTARNKRMNEPTGVINRTKMNGELDEQLERNRNGWETIYDAHGRWLRDCGQERTMATRPRLSSSMQLHLTYAAVCNMESFPVAEAAVSDVMVVTDPCMCVRLAVVQRGPLQRNDVMPKKRQTDDKTFCNCGEPLMSCNLASQGHVWLSSQFQSLYTSLSQ